MTAFEPHHVALYDQYDAQLTDLIGETRAGSMAAAHGPEEDQQAAALAVGNRLADTLTDMPREDIQMLLHLAIVRIARGDNT